MTFSPAKEELIQNQNGWQNAADLALYDAVHSMTSLASGAWTDDNTAAWAPDRDWLDETRQQLKDLQDRLAELEAAHDCLSML